jgi:hypothetical protein
VEAKRLKERAEWAAKTAKWRADNERSSHITRLMSRFTLDQLREAVTVELVKG